MTECEDTISNVEEGIELTTMKKKESQIIDFEELWKDQKLVDEDMFNEYKEMLLDGDFDAVDELENINIRDERGWSLVHAIAGENADDSLMYLIEERDALVNIQNEDGWTPLHEAAEEGKFDNFKMIVNAGGDPMIREFKKQRTALQVAINTKETDIVSWILNNTTTWLENWDNILFEQMAICTPGAIETVLEAVRRHPHNQDGKRVIHYKIKELYGAPDIPVHRTPLAIVTTSPYAANMLTHKTMQYILDRKWELFARRMFIIELMMYLLLLVVFMIPNTFLANGDWHDFSNFNDYAVGFFKVLTWILVLYHIVYSELREYFSHGKSICSHFADAWNVINFLAYGSTLCSIPFEFFPGGQDAKECILSVACILLWLGLLQYFQVPHQTGVLVAMIGKMLRDILLFLLLYVVFQIGFSGAFYLLLHGQKGYTSFMDGLITVFLIMQGDFDYDEYNVEGQAKSYLAVGLLLVYMLVGTTMLLNLLIAMMASTYDSVQDSAEGEALRVHTEAIIRLESMLSTDKRQSLYDEIKEKEVTWEDIETAVDETVVADMKLLKEKQDYLMESIAKLTSIIQAAEAERKRFKGLREDRIVEILERNSKQLEGSVEKSLKELMWNSNSARSKVFGSTSNNESEEEAAIKVQSSYRMYRERKKYLARKHN